jgi:hypothetical protein
LTIGVTRATTHYATATFDLAAVSNTQNLTAGYSGASASIIASANGFYRCSLTVTTDTLTDVLIGLAANPTFANGGRGFESYTGDNTSSLILWGAQLNFTNMEGGVTSSLTTYYPTTTAAYYAPRFDYNPSTLQPLGLLIEEARTNSIRNNTMVGAVAGTPGTLPTNWSVAGAAGLTTNVIGTGTSNGVIYVDLQVTGTSSATSYILAFDTTTQIAASVGQNWAWSSWIAFVGGSLSNVTTVSADFRESNSGGTQLAAGTVALSTLTSSLVRQSATRTLSEATTAFIQPRLRLTITNGAAINITLRIGLPQLELGAFATSVIPTTTTALTRNADVASMTGTNFSSWYNASEGTLYAEAQLQGVGGLAPAALVSIDDVTTNNRIILRRSLVAGTANFRFVSSAGSIDANLLSGSNTGLNKMIAAFKAGDQQSANNGTLFTGITPVASLPIVTRLAIGDGTGSTPASGYIRRIAYYPTRLPDATLQALTA